MHNLENTEKHISINRLRSIQYLRGVAALVVVLTHSGVYLLQSYDYPAIRYFFGDYWSYFGVIAFFCMSGFLLTSLTTKTSMLVFFVHRTIRIFPAYLLALLATLFVFRITGLSFPQIDWRIFLLIPIGPEFYRPLHVEWTLIFEMAYYVILAFFCLNIFRRLLPAFYFIWFILLAYLFLSGKGPNTILPDGLDIYLPAWNMAFIAGGFSWFLYDKNWVNWRLGFLGFVFLLICTIHLYATAFLAPVGMSLLIAYLAQIEKLGKLKLQSGILETLGKNHLCRKSSNI